MDLPNPRRPDAGLKSEREQRRDEERPRPTRDKPLAIEPQGVRKLARKRQELVSAQQRARHTKSLSSANHRRLLSLLVDNVETIQDPLSYDALSDEFSPRSNLKIDQIENGAPLSRVTPHSW